MRILYVVSRPLEINTSASVRNRATILGFLENGYSVDLFTSQPDENHSAYDASLAVSSIHTQYIRLGGVQNLARFGRRFAFLSHLKKVIFSFMQRHEIYDNLKNIVNFTSEINLKEENYDYIVSSSDPKSSHLFVEKLLEKQGKDFHGKWIQVWGDPFLGDITLKNKSNSSQIKAEEKRLLCGADKIIYVSKPTLELQQKIYPESSEKMFHLPIPYMDEVFYEVRDLNTAENINLVYCGDYNKDTRNILPLYNAVKGLTNVHLTICGGSDMSLESCDNITVLGRVPYSKVVQLEKEADILIHLSNLHGSQIPGKIYQYSGTNKPILFILDGEAQKMKEQFEKYDRYCFCKNSEKELSDAILSIINQGQKYSPVPDFSKKSLSRKIIGE